jgi:hypothetical protein
MCHFYFTMAHKPGPLSRLPLDTARANSATSERLGVVAEPAYPTRDTPAFDGEPSGRQAPPLFWRKENQEEFSRMPATVHTPMRNVPFPEFLPSQVKISNQAVPGPITGLQPGWIVGGTRRVRLVREEGRGVSSQYGREGGGGATAVRLSGGPKPPAGPSPDGSAAP